MIPAAAGHYRSSMTPLTSAIAITWERNASYAQRLLAGVTPEMITAQPVPGRVINHPAWIMSHLNLYAGIAVSLARGEAIEDPAEHRFGAKSEPLPDSRAYDAPEQLLSRWQQLHQEGMAALKVADERRTGAPTPIERWRSLHPTVGDMLVTLMVKHEAGHLGQLSAWRRAMGLARTTM